MSISKLLQIYSKLESGIYRENYGKLQYQSKNKILKGKQVDYIFQFTGHSTVTLYSIHYIVQFLNYSN